VGVFNFTKHQLMVPEWNPQGKMFRFSTEIKDSLMLEGVPVSPQTKNAPMIIGTFLFPGR
jgi:hypothetical protein